MIKLIKMKYKKYYDLINYNIFGYFSKVLVIITSLLIINRFSLSEYGIFALYTTYSIIIVKLTNFSFDKVHLLFAAGEKNKNFKVYNNIIVLKFFLTMLKYFLVFLLLNKIEYKFFFIVIFTIYELQSYYELNSTIFDLQNRFRYKTYFNFTLNFLIFLWLIYLVFFLKKLDLEWFIFGSFIIRIVIFFILTFNLNIKINIRYIEIELIKKILLNGINIVFILVFISLYFRIDILMLEYFKISVYDIGIYAAIYKIFEGVSFISTQIRTLFFPKFIKEESKEKLFSNLKKLLLIQVFISFGLIAFLIFNKILILKFILNFDESVLYKYDMLYKVIIITIFFSFLNDSLMNFYMSKKKYMYIQISTFLVLLLNILLNIFTISGYGIVGAAFSTICTEAVLTILFILFLKRSFN